MGKTALALAVVTPRPGDLGRQIVRFDQYVDSATINPIIGA